MVIGKKSAFASGVALLLPLACPLYASGSFIEANYFAAEMGDSEFSVDFEGFDLRARGDVGANWFVMGNLRKWQGEETLDFFGFAIQIEIDMRETEFGGGYRYKLGEEGELSFHGGLRKQAFEVRDDWETFEENRDGHFIGFALHHELSESLDLELGVTRRRDTYQDEDWDGNLHDVTAYSSERRVGLVWRWSERWNMGLRWFEVENDFADSDGY